MTNMAAMPIYGKNLKKSSSPEPIDQWPWNLVCVIQYGSTTKVIQIMTLGWPWPILRQDHIGHIGFCMGKSENYLIFGNYRSLRSHSCLKHLAEWVNEVECVSKVKVILWPWSKVTQISKLKLVFLKNSWAIRDQNLYESLRENRNENLYKWVVYCIYGKNLKKIFFSRINRPMTLKLCSIIYGSTTKVVQIITLGWIDLIYAMVTFGHIGFCMEKSENYFFCWNYCSLRSQSCLKNSTKWVDEVEWVSEVKAMLWPWSEALRFQS